MNQTVVRAGSVKRCGPRQDGRLEVSHVGTWDVLVGAGLLTDGMAVAPCRARHASESNSGTTVVRADTVVRGKGAGTSSPHHKRLIVTVSSATNRTAGVEYGEKSTLLWREVHAKYLGFCSESISY